MAISGLPLSFRFGNPDTAFDSSLSPVVAMWKAWNTFQLWLERSDTSLRLFNLGGLNIEKNESNMSPSPFSIYDLMPWYRDRFVGLLFPVPIMIKYLPKYGVENNSNFSFFSSAGARLLSPRRRSPRWWPPATSSSSRPGRRTWPSSSRPPTGRGSSRPTTRSVHYYFVFLKCMDFFHSYDN